MPNYAHQQETIDKDPKIYGLFLGTGSGKTRIASTLAEGMTLVVCPKTIRDKKQWSEEWVDKLGLDRSRLRVLSKEDFKKLWDGTWDSIEYFKQFTTFIGDEAHLLAGVQPSTYQKNRKKYPKTSELFTKLNHMLRSCNFERIYLLTATPTSQPMTVWGLATLMGYNWDFFKFRDTFYFEKSRNMFFKKKDKACQKILADCVNHIGRVGRLEDWFDVPEQTYKEELVEPTKEQKSTLKTLQLMYPDPQKQLQKRHQLEQGVFDGERVKENKSKAIESYLREFKKVVVYARFTEQIKIYEEYFNKKKYKTLTLTGETKDRKEVLEQAESMDKGIIIIQSQISAGYQLPSFPCMIFASEFGFTHRTQSEGRILRADHLKKNLYVTLICGIADQRMRKAVKLGEEFDEEVHAVNIANSNKFL